MPTSPLLIATSPCAQFNPNSTDKIHITELQLQSANVPFAETVLDLGVVVDSQPIEYVCSRVCCQSFLFILVASTHDFHTFPLYGCCEDAGKCVRQQSTGLLQQSTRRCNEWPAYEASVRSECRRSIRQDVPEIRHITPVLRDLHWLPLYQRIIFKVATLVYKCLHGFASPYLAEDCVLVASLSGRQHLRSADT